MPHLGTRTATALSLILSAALGYSTNLLTSHWSWGLAAGSAAFLAAMIYLAVRTPTTTPPPPGRTVVEVTAKDGSRIAGTTLDATAGAHITTTADHTATITDTTARATGADLTVNADAATLDGNEFTAT